MATTSYEEINAIEINSEGEVFVNDGKISALGGANIFGGKGVDGGLHIAAGIFAIDKRDKIRINDVQGGYFTTPVSAYLYYPRVTNGKYGVMGIPDSAWKNQLGHKRVEVHELESDKYYTYTGWKDSDFAIDFSGNNYKEIAICGRSTYNTDAVFLQATYGSTALGNKSVLVYYPDTADKFRVTYDYASDPYFKYGNTTLKYDWKIWHTVKDDTPDFQMTNTSATINPIKPISSVDFSGKIVYVQCTVSDVSNYNSDEVFYINTTESTYIEPTTSVLGVLEFTNQTPPMDRYSTSTNIYGTVTGDTFSFSFNNIPLTSKYINEGYVITRGYEIYKSGMTSELLDKKTGIAGTNDITASFIPTTSGLYTIYEYLYLDKNGTRVQVANNVIYLSVKDGYQIFEAHATVDAPAHGRLPDFDAVTDTEHVKVVDVDWSKKADNGEYYLMDDNETFIAGEYYECIVVFEATDGYTFFDTPTGTVNSKDRILYNHDEQRAAFGVQFECPLGVIFTDDSAAVGGGKLEVDVERMAELDDEFMEAYLNDEIKYKWFYDGRLKTTTKNNSYEIKNNMLGHYIAVKVVYGDKSVVSEEFEIIKASTTGKLGDVDGDGEVTVMDATAIQMHLASMKALTSDELSRADTDKDGAVSVMDATQIQRLIAQLITEF